MLSKENQMGAREKYWTHYPKRSEQYKYIMNTTFLKHQEKKRCTASARCVEVSLLEEGENKNRTL